jgi:glycosyltransferase involved in cell wall biosynthesis
MRIAEVAPLYEGVPPRGYGGTERVVSYLTEELVARGHDVTLFASGDSVTAARLAPCCPQGLRLNDRRSDPVALHLAMLLRVYERAREFDVIHCHTDYLGLPLTRLTDRPTVLTLHGRLDLLETHPVYRAFPEAALVSVSDAQRTPLTGVTWAATVHHGLPPDLFRFAPGPGRFLLFLGRISPEKRPDAAIRVAVAAGVPLRIAAKVDPADRVYFEEVIRPLLGHPLVEFVGEVDDAGKQALLGEALALLFPVDWPEPFGLVMIEALASGTPVIARRRGSVPEVIEHGRTGFLCESEDEMVAAVARLDALCRADCREAFERRFTVGRMAADYLRVFAACRARTSARKAGGAVVVRATPRAPRVAAGDS